MFGFDGFRLLGPRSKPAKRKPRKTKAMRMKAPKELEYDSDDSSGPVLSHTEHLRSLLAERLRAQLVEKDSLNGPSAAGSYPPHSAASARLTAQVPNLAQADLEALLGSELYSRASKGPKMITVTTDADDVRNLFGNSMSKKLRWGGSLILKGDALKFTY
ncbi:hypothetical protein TSOC_002264 [Tetrabaena socialis]|uniref:Uncharacterized protein n=1 Tax=Tetrabaena socialis TaxID=47790 RepID=A0A2J8AEL0_9CHLO|nr:hypothetical protein TSOC_002264 [Tetrabaena socialis]|eukprot:PNH10958.1 hypothetical protein TSOC_002264 [Tetrabaena socialis]